MQVRCTVQSPALAILDNHESHLSVEVLDYAKEHGMIMLSFPPHCSHMMQPLDKTVFGPFKKYYAAAMKGWMSDNKGRPLGIYNVPSLVAQAYPKAMTPENITAGFRATGIFPHDRNVFPPDAYLPAQTTDRPDPTVTEQAGSAPPVPAPVSGTGAAETSNSTVEPSVLPGPPVMPRSQYDSPPSAQGQAAATHAPETSSLTVEPSALPGPPMVPRSQYYSAQGQIAATHASETSLAGPSKIVTPSDIRPFTRAPPRKKQAGRRSGSTRILTDTPVKNDISMRKKAIEKKVKDDSNAAGQQQSGDSRPTPVRKRLKYSRPAAKIMPPKRKRGSSSSANDTNPSCLYCDELYLESVNEYRPWIQCQGVCKKWCHRVCAGVDRKDKQFVCEFCVSH